jgi:hypothetical protein
MALTQLPEHRVAIHSAPRSGSSWLGQIFKSSPHVEFRYQPLFSYAFKDFLGPDSSQERIAEFMTGLSESEDDYLHNRIPDVYVEYPDLGERIGVTHLVWKEVRYHHILKNLLSRSPDIRLVGLVRHPCATIDSWLNSPREFKSEWNVAEQWRRAEGKNQGRPEEFNGFDKWLEVAKLFTQLEAEYPHRVHLVRYADLNARPQEVIEDLFAQCKLPYEQATEDFIRHSRSKDVADANSVFRLTRPDDRWRTRLPKELAQEMLIETKRMGLERFLHED